MSLRTLCTRRFATVLLTYHQIIAADTNNIIYNKRLPLNSHSARLRRRRSQTRTPSAAALRNKPFRLLSRAIILTYNYREITNYCKDSCGRGSFRHIWDRHPGLRSLIAPIQPQYAHGTVCVPTSSPNVSRFFPQLNYLSQLLLPI